MYEFYDGYIMTKNSGSVEVLLVPSYATQEGNSQKIGERPGYFVRLGSTRALYDGRGVNSKQ